MSARVITRNALVAAVYGAIALVLPATAFANFRLTTAMYLLAAFDKSLIPGLALGNVIAGVPQGPVDMLLGGVVGLLTSFACALLGKKLGPIAILVVPTLLVPLWLAWLFHAPYWTVVVVVGTGQAISAALAWVVIYPVGKRLWKHST